MAIVPQRNIGIDILRIMAVLMIVLAHVVVSVYVRPDFFGGSAWLASFFTITIARLGVPVFFIISGYLLAVKERSFSQNLRHTFKRLIIPFLIWSALTYLGLYITNTLPSIDSTFLLSAGRTEYYFLIGLAIIYLLNPIIIKITKFSSPQELKLLLVFLAISTVGQTGVAFFYHHSPFSIFNYWFLGLFYFMYGQYYRLYPKSRFSFKISSLLLAVPLLINFFVVYQVRIQGYSQDLFLESYFGPTVLISSLGLFNLIMRISYKNIGKTLTKAIFAVSSLSFGVYLVHAIVLDLILHKTKINPYGSVSVNLWLFLITATILTISISYLISYLFSKNKYGRISLGQ